MALYKYVLLVQVLLLLFLLSLLIYYYDLPLLLASPTQNGHATPLLDAST